MITLQRTLQKLGLLANADGIFGPLTEAAIRRLQLEHGFVEDDLRGPKTTSTKPIALTSVKPRNTTSFVIKSTPDDSASNRYSVAHLTNVVYCYFGFRGHVKVVLREPVHGRTVWYVFLDHVVIDSTSILLPVRWKSQRDNLFNPSGACNVTSVAMCLDYLGVRSRESGMQLEDELYEFCLANGLSRHSPEHLAKLIQLYGRHSNFTFNGSLELARKHLATGMPCIIHGYFTSFGHIVVLTGYNADGFFVHDPWGEWTSSGYLKDGGSNLHYSNNLITKTCATENQFWLHRVSY